MRLLNHLISLYIRMYRYIVDAMHGKRRYSTDVLEGPVYTKHGIMMNLMYMVNVRKAVIDWVKQNGPAPSGRCPIMEVWMHAFYHSPTSLHPSKYNNWKDRVVVPATDYGMCTNPPVADQHMWS